MTDEIKVNQETRMLARQICQWVTVFHGRKLEDMIAKAIGRREQATRIAAENAALERAALFIETHTSDYSTGKVVKASLPIPSTSNAYMANAIRALKAKAPE